MAKLICMMTRGRSTRVGYGYGYGYGLWFMVYG